MRTLTKCLVFALFLPAGASADKVKEVVISGQTAPIDIQVMPDVAVSVISLPVPPARTKGFEIRAGGSLHSGGPADEKEIQVQRDSILKFVNIEFDSIQTINLGFPLACKLRVFLRFPSPDDNDLIKLGELNVDEDSIPTQRLSGIQFATGDIFVPAHSALVLRVTTTGTCYGHTYGILFEQE